MNWTHSVVDWFARHKQRIGLIAVGHTVKQIEEYIFDWLLYGAVVYKCTEIWGPYAGSIASFFVMTPLSALFCFAYIRLYDWAKKDWFGFEALKELHAVESTGWFGMSFRRIMRRGDIPVFLLLTLQSDPFMVTVYFRKKENQHAGLTSRDWKIFWGSVLFANAYWTLYWTVIIVAVEFVWNALIKPLVF